MRKIILFILFFIFTGPAYSYMLTPDPSVSPGSLCFLSDPDFDEIRYSESIAHCRRNVSTKTKKIVCARDSVYDRGRYTVDHIIPLSLGGSNHQDNLWCQHKDIYTGKIEYQLYRAVKDDELSVYEARTILHDKKFNPTPTSLKLQWLDPEDFFDQF